MASDAAVRKAAITDDPILVRTSRCRAVARMGHLLGACSIVCSRSPWLKIDGISGTSAGALMPRCLSMVMPKAGPRVPGQLWRLSGAASPRRLASVLCGAAPSIDSRLLDAGLFAYLCRHGSHVSPGFALWDLNPMGKNPLRAIFWRNTINFERLAGALTKLFITKPCRGRAAVTCSGTRLLRRTFCSPPPVCPPCFRL